MDAENEVKMSFTGTRANTGAVVGSSVGYNTLEEKSPIMKSRQRTNTPFMFLFSIINIIWISVGIYVVSSSASSTTNKLSNGSHEAKSMLDDIFSLIKTSSVIVVPSLMIFTVGLTFLFILLLKGVLTKIFVYIAIILTGLLLCLSFLSGAISIYVIGAVGYSGKDPEKVVRIIFQTIVTIFQFIYLLIVFHCIMKVKVNYITDVISKSCQAIFHYYYLIVFCPILLLLYMFIVLFSTKVFISLLISDGAMILHFINIFGGVYMLIFISLLGEIIIAQSIATWHWTTDTQTTQQSVILISTISTVKYHVGTIAYAATGFLPLIHVIFLSFKVKTIQKSDIIWVRILTRINLIYKMINYALIQTAIHGHDFGQGSKRSFDLALRNCSRYLAVNELLATVHILVASIIGIIIGIATYVMMNSINFINGKPQNTSDANMDLIMLWAVLYIVVISLLPYITLTMTAARTIMFCNFEDELENTEATENPYLMNGKFERVPIE